MGTRDAHTERTARGDVRFLVGVAVLLLAAAIFHSVVLLVKETPWDGPVSWRKPIVFALSFAITDLTVAWVLHMHPMCTRKHVL